MELLNKRRPLRKFGGPPGPQVSRPDFGAAPKPVVLDLTTWAGPSFRPRWAFGARALVRVLLVWARPT
eukprot:4109603-Lingulodinium_polyedra.AAC.1